MFGVQRVGDLCWAAGDQRARGFLLGATAGRTTLNGEGLQHEDGHSHVMSATVPNCRSYDPAFGYELAVIIQHGLKEMYVDNRDGRSEEHTSELQSLMRISYAVFCLKKKIKNKI